MCIESVSSTLDTVPFTIYGVAYDIPRTHRDIAELQQIIESLEQRSR